MKQSRERIADVGIARPAYAAVLMLLTACVLVVMSIAIVWHLDGARTGRRPANLSPVELVAGGPISRDSGWLPPSTWLDLQRRYERELEARLQGLLDATLGPGKSVIRVAADIAPVAPEMVFGDTLTRSDGNVPDVTGGVLRRLTVAVVVDSRFAGVEASDGRRQNVSDVIRPDYAGRMEALLIAASGLDDRRSDRLELVFLPLAGYRQASMATGVTADAPRELSGDVIWRIIYVILAFVALLAFYRYARVLSAMNRSPATRFPEHAEGTEDAVSRGDDAYEVKAQETPPRPDAVAKVLRDMMAGKGVS